jgi:hypothetical protein
MYEKSFSENLLSLWARKKKKKKKTETTNNDHWKTEEDMKKCSCEFQMDCR